MRHLITQKNIKIVRHFLYCTFRDLKYQKSERDSVPRAHDGGHCQHATSHLLAARISIDRHALPGYTMEQEMTSTKLGRWPESRPLQAPSCEPATGEVTN